MSGGEEFTITQDDEASLRQEAESLERDIASMQQRLVLVRRGLEAIEALKALKGVNGRVQLTGRATLVANARTITKGKDQEEEPLTSAILRIVSQSRSGMRPGEIREALIREGIPEEKLGNYFYSAISRLKQRKKLSMSRKRYRIAEKPEASNDPESSEASKRERHDRPLNTLPGLEGR